ncbi:IclR family transcriptional regulator [Pseudonocardia kunmingensis]|uniref:IclR family transcriptional regulator n=1 Tax=Pseudonocardia kunmingensis TaxID=630975 RepID=A0A543D1L0_9PSEU|nr:IclR family transcriptional regulator [Pseudonocardia kunmingensis]TQM03192.1 IclR family transcriptional regulator [Pseudonocardia kunmingensis]
MAAGGAGERGSVAKEHRTVRRVTSILEAVARQRDGVRLGALAELLDAPKSSVFGLVKGLVADGYLREQDGAYRLGPAVSALLAPPVTALDAVRPRMQRLRAAFDETVMWCTRVGDSVVYTEVAESSQLIRYSAPLRTRRPLHPTSSGKCFLAYTPPAALRRYLAEHVAADDVERVRAELERVRRDGVAFNRGETLPDVSAAAAPVLVHGQPLGCLAVAGPTVRLGGRLDEVAALLPEVVGELATELAG